MAKQSNVNLTPATGSVAIWELVDFLVSSLGFEQVEGADGTTYPIAITSGASGAAGLGNANAWVRVREPGGVGGREWVFQRDTVNNTDWRIKTSALDGFVGGTPGATQVPSATDEQLLWGAGSDASPTHTALFEADNTYRWHLVGFDVAEDTVYPWYAFSHENGGGEGRTFLGVESLLPGTYPALVGTRAVPVSGEPDPAIYICSHDPFGSDPTQFGPNVGQWGSAATGFTPARGWYAMNGSNAQVEAFVVLTAAGYAVASGADWAAPGRTSKGYGVNPLSSQDQLLPLFMGRDFSATSQVGGKGMTAHIRLSTVSGRGYPDTVDVGAERWVYASAISSIGVIVIPFEDGTTPLT